MRLVTPKVAITILMLFLTTVTWSCEILSFVAPATLCLDKSATYRGTGKKGDGCGLDTRQDIRLISGPGNATINFTSEDRNEAEISFSEVGTYVLEYSFEDEAACGTTICTMQATTEVFFPSASFVEDTLFICNGESVEADINFFDADRVSVSGQGQISLSSEPGGIGTYKTSIPVSNSFVLKIVSAQLSTCENDTFQDSLVVMVLDKPSLMPIDTICNATNELYVAKYEISGGDGNYTLLTDAIGTIEGNILTTVELPKDQSFNSTIDSGPTCGEFSGSESASCDCTLKAGVMQTERVEACEDDIIVVSHDDSNLDKRPTDSVIYVLHNNDQAEIGVSYARSYEPSFALPSDEVVDSQLYISVVVGPFTLDNFNIAEIECKVVSVGTPVRWFSKDDVAISGKLEVCAGEKNRMFTVNISDELKTEREDLFWYTSEGSGVVIESQRNDRAFVSFPAATSSGKLFYQVDRQLNDKVCSSVDSIEIKVDGTATAPEESEIILWPGDIFASTSEGPCYQWGYIDRFANFSFNFVGENNKYFFSDEQIGQQKLIERAYFVAIFDTPNCEFSLNNCNSITFYNQSVLSGLSVGVEDDFQLAVAPNPSDGHIRLEIKGSYKGDYKLETFSELGERVGSQVISKQYSRSITNLDYSGFQKGMYFFRITNQQGDQQVIKMIIAR